MKANFNTVGNLYATDKAYRETLSKLGFKFKPHRDGRYKNRWEIEGETIIDVDTLEDLIQIMRATQTSLILTMDDDDLSIDIYDDYVE
jgi:hypothetical protein